MLNGVSNEYSAVGGNGNCLNLRRLPARLDVKYAAQVLGFQPDDIAVLIRNRLIKPLGNPAPNGKRYFAACQILPLANDVEWLGKATAAVSRNWRAKNNRNTQTAAQAAA
jgi:hypothetical protein